MVFPPGFRLVLGDLTDGAARDSIGRPAAEQPPASPCESARQWCARRLPSRMRAKRQTKRLTDSVTGESNCRRNIIRLSQSRYSPSGDSSKSEYSSWGVPSEKLWTSPALPAQR